MIQITQDQTPKPSRNSDTRRDIIRASPIDRSQIPAPEGSVTITVKILRFNPEVGSYFGPAAIVNAHRFIFDSRDEAAEERLDILNDAEGGSRARAGSRRPAQGLSTVKITFCNGVRC